MARPVKRGLDYFPLDVNIFENEKIAAISGEFQLKGEIVVIKLLCAIYRNGYYYEWSEMNQMHLLRSLPTITPGLLNQVVERLVKWGFFNKALFDSSNILTSIGIQERYFAATARRRVTIKDFPYILVNVDNNSINVNNNSAQSPLMSAKSTQIKGNKIKTPLNLPTGSINQGFSSGGGNLASLPREEINPKIPQNPNFSDGVQRNYKGLLNFFERHNIDLMEQAEIILLSNYGQIGHPLWKYVCEVDCNTKIQFPGKYILSRLRNNNACNVYD